MSTATTVKALGGVASSPAAPAASEHVARRFTYHAPSAEEIKAYQDINEASLAFAAAIEKACPANDAREDAIKSVAVARYQANMAVVSKDH